MSNKMKEYMKRIKLTQIFSFAICVIVLFTAMFTFGCMWILQTMGIVDIGKLGIPFFVFEIISAVLGMLAAAVISGKILKPLYEMIKATEKIAKGDYTTRLYFESIYEFKQLGEKFNCMAEELGSLEMLRKDFVNHFSHEFNTPINSIQGFASILKDEELTKEQREDYLNRIISGADRLSSLAFNVLNLSKMEQQTILTNKGRLNITEQIRRVIVMLSFRWEQKEIEFEFNCEEYYLVGNEELLEHLWTNLLDNAIKYSFIGSKIFIEIKEEKETLAIIIRDQGKGIAEESVPYIFDKFYRSKSSQATPGTGLGLTIAHKVVMLHGGDIFVESEVGKGTEFTVLFPKE